MYAGGQRRNIFYGAHKWTNVDLNIMDRWSVYRYVLTAILCFKSSPQDEQQETDSGDDTYVRTSFVQSRVHTRLLT
jgi:hypothetical protein